MNRSDTVRENLEAGFNCAESVVGAFSDLVPIPKSTAVRTATPFGAGMGRTGNVCGLVSGGAIVLGLVGGRDDPADDRTKERAYDAVAMLIREVTVLYSSVLCPEILGEDLGHPLGRRRAIDQGLLATRCPAVAVDVVRILERVLEPLR